LEFALGFDQAVLRDLKFGGEIVEHLLADELLLVEVARPLVIVLGLFHREAGAFDLGFRAVLFREQIGVVDLDQDIPLLDRLAGDDVERFDFAPNFRFDVQGVGRRDVPADLHAKIEIPFLGNRRQIPQVDRLFRASGEFILERIPPAAEEGGDHEKGG
jgi:hypothetical protein